MTSWKFVASLKLAGNKSNFFVQIYRIIFSYDWIQFKWNCKKLCHHPKKHSIGAHFNFIWTNWKNASTCKPDSIWTIKLCTNSIEYVDKSHQSTQITWWSYFNQYNHINQMNISKMIISWLVILLTSLFATKVQYRVQNMVAPNVQPLWNQPRMKH